MTFPYKAGYGVYECDFTVSLVEGAVDRIKKELKKLSHKNISAEKKKNIIYDIQ